MPDDVLLPEHRSERVRDPELRTIETDVSAFLKSTKPTLLSLAAREGGIPEHRGRERRQNILFAVVAIALIIIIAILIAVFVWGRRIPEIVVPVARPVPPPAA